MDLKHKLKESIPSNTLKIIELYNKVDSGQLSPSPNFQRKLVWKKQHKYEFIKTILMNFPFPEIYIASSELNVETLKTSEIVVDGQQRLTTIVDYIKGTGDFKDQIRITPFEELDLDNKREFLNYPVSVKDLKDIGLDKIKEIFQRINSTDYSLNSNETLNAQYGDGEFAIYAKQLVDSELSINESITDVIIEPVKRNFVVDFFHNNNVFKENDIKRMFDSQYIMLITSTIMDGSYFGRNSKINTYLEKYNIDFSSYNEVLEKIINSITIINGLNLQKESYWFNKANLFTLIIEFKDLKHTDLDFEKLEFLLLDLEEKVDIYFEGDEDQINLLTADEKKYFEVARQGSHELASRQHRGKVIRDVITQSIIDKEAPNEENHLEKENIDFVTIIPTKTGLTKGIMDATSSVREFFKEKGIHNYETQELGPEHKVLKDVFFVLKEGKTKETKMSLYRSKGRGDYRIWFTDLKLFADADDKLAITFQDNIISIINISKMTN
ncbi:MAG: DUF262 domain-containing protein [Gelidibacter sp.]